MQREQDAYLDRNYLQPAIAHAQAAGLVQPLSHAIVYDTHIQGGWLTCSQAVNKAIGAVAGNVTEGLWIAQYLETRTAFLKGVTNPDTSYRMVAYGSILKAGNWNLDLPFTFRGVLVSSEDFETAPSQPIIIASPIPDPEIDSLPVLRPQIPYTRGDMVHRLQKLLNTAGAQNSEDETYGPFTQALVSAFQKSKGMKPDAVVGPQTWAALMEGASAA